MPDFAKRYRDMLSAVTDTHDWRLYALESHCVDCELKLRDHIATLEAEVARLQRCAAVDADRDAWVARAEAAEQRAERYRPVVEAARRLDAVVQTDNRRWGDHENNNLGHCHRNPPQWDAGGECERCAAYVTMRQGLAALDKTQ